MAELVVIAFPSEAKAEEVRQKLLAMQKEYLIELGDAVIAVKDNQGHIKLNQLLNTTAAGAVSGAFWGSLGGFKRLSQHHDEGGCDDHSKAAIGSIWEGAIAVPRSTASGRTR